MIALTSESHKRQNQRFLFLLIFYEGQPVQATLAQKGDFQTLIFLNIPFYMIFL